MELLYKNIKQQFFLNKFRPAELDGGRFAECVLRLLEFVNEGTFTPSTVERLQQTVLGKQKPDRVIETLVYEYNEKAA